MSHHHLIDGFYLKPAAVVATTGGVDALKVPALQATEKRVVKAITTQMNTENDHHNKFNKMPR